MNITRHSSFSKTEREVLALEELEKSTAGHLEASELDEV
jgi:hypothetical protein